MLIPNCLHIYVCICISVRFFGPTPDESLMNIDCQHWKSQEIKYQLTSINNQTQCFAPPSSIRTSYLHIYIYIHRLIQWHESHMNMYITTILMSRFSFEFCLFIMFFFYYFFGAIQHLMWDLIIDDYWWRIFIAIHWKKYFRISSMSYGREPRN